MRSIVIGGQSLSRFMLRRHGALTPRATTSTETDCVRCVPCRKKEQGLAQQRELYEQLFHLASPSDDELLEMAECCMSTIEAAIFSLRQQERVRMRLNRVATLARYDRAPS